jgi:Fe-S cluster assembly iron-binding protein IscA
MEENEGIKFVVHQDILDQFGSFHIDYISNLFRKGFVVSSAYGTGAC